MGPVSSQVHRSFLAGYQSQRRLTATKASWWNILVLWYALAMVPADVRESRLSMVGTWEANERGVIPLPSGRLVRGRALRRRDLDGVLPEFGLYLLGTRPEPLTWEARWVRWPDFRLPADRHDARNALYEAWDRSRSERVEVACQGGVGRTGTALACIATLDGVPAHNVVSYVREHYDRRAVETPWQRRFVTRFTDP